MAEKNSTPFALTDLEISALSDSPLKAEIIRTCNADQDDEFRLGLVGEPGEGLASRGLLEILEGGTTTRVFLAAPELRQVASALLNVADAIDGTTPLVFFDPSAPSAKEPER